MNHYDNYIAGQWIGSEHRIDNINPSDISQNLGMVAQARVEDLNKAVESAKTAQLEWARSPLETRQRVLHNIGETMIQRAEAIGKILSLEEGKPLAEGRGEVYRAGQFFTYYAAEVLRQIGDLADSVRPGVEVMVQREPVGVVGVIAPWNFPIAIPAWKIAPALAFGNGVILKPANLVPASAVALMQIIADQPELPKGLVNLVMGSGSAIGNAMSCHADIDAITFTGSLDVGKQIASSAVTNLTKIQMEMGSKNALVVMDDANMDTAITCSLGGAFGGTGQKCTASSRLVVHEAVHDEFVEKLAQGADAMVVDHALKEGTQLGPVVSKTQLQQNQNYLQIGKQEGANLLCGGDVVSRDTEGYYMTPAIFTETGNSMQINRDEIFGPIASIIKVSSYDEALATVNDTRFGLSSGIITQSLATATHFRRNVKTGCAMVNLPTAGTDYHVPFGGRGDSSYGVREQGQYAVEFYTTIKTSYISA